MVVLSRLSLVLAVLALFFGALSRYAGMNPLPIGAAQTWLQLCGLLLLFAIALMADEIVARLKAKA